MRENEACDETETRVAAGSKLIIMNARRVDPGTFLGTAK